MIHENNGQIGGVTTKGNKGKVTVQKTKGKVKGIIKETGKDKGKPKGPGKPVVLNKKITTKSSFTLKDYVTLVKKESVSMGPGKRKKKVLIFFFKKKEVNKDIELSISIEELTSEALIGSPKLTPLYKIVELAAKGTQMGILKYWTNCHLTSILQIFEEFITCTLLAAVSKVHAIAKRSKDQSIKAKIPVFQQMAIDVGKLTLNKAVVTVPGMNSWVKKMFEGSTTGKNETSDAWKQLMSSEIWNNFSETLGALYTHLYVGETPRNYVEWGSSSAADVGNVTSQFYGITIDFCYICGRAISPDDKPPPEGEHVIHALAWAMVGGSRVMTKHMNFPGIKSGHLFACQCCNQIKRQQPFLFINQDGELYIEDGQITTLLTTIWNEAISQARSGAGGPGSNKYSCKTQTYAEKLITIDHTAGGDIDRGRAAFIQKRQPIIKSILSTILVHLNRLLLTLANDNGKSRADNIFILLLTNLFARFISSGILAHVHTSSVVLQGGNGNRHHGKGPTSHFHKIPSKSRSHVSYKKHHSKKDNKTTTASMDEDFFKLTEVALKFGIKCHLEKLIELGVIDRIDLREEGKEDETVYEKETSEPLVNATEKEVDENIRHLKKYVGRLQHLYEFLGISDHDETSVSEHSSVRIDPGRTTRKRRRHNRKHSKRHDQSVSEKSANERQQSASEKSASASTSANERSPSHRTNPFAALALSDSSPSVSTSASASDKSLHHANHSKTTNTENQEHVLSELPKKSFSSRHSISHRPPRHSIGRSTRSQSLRVQG